MSGRSVPRVTQAKLDMSSQIQSSVRQQTLRQVSEWIESQTVMEPVDDVEAHLNYVLMYMARQIREDKMK